MFYNFDWLIFHHFLQLIYRLTPLTSVAKSNENLVNQKLCNTVLILDALYVYSYLMAAKCWRVNLIFISPSKTQRIMYYFSSKYGPNVFKLIFKNRKNMAFPINPGTTIYIMAPEWPKNCQNCKILSPFCNHPISG